MQMSRKRKNTIMIFGQKQKIVRGKSVAVAEENSSEGSESELSSEQKVTVPVSTERSGQDYRSRAEDVSPK